MLVRPPSEGKNTVQHDITSNERAHPVHIVCWAGRTAFLSLLFDLGDTS